MLANKIQTYLEENACHSQLTNHIPFNTAFDYPKYMDQDLVDLKSIPILQNIIENTSSPLHFKANAYWLLLTIANTLKIADNVLDFVLIQLVKEPKKEAAIIRDILYYLPSSWRIDQGVQALFQLSEYKQHNLYSNWAFAFFKFKNLHVKHHQLAAQKTIDVYPKLGSNEQKAAINILATFGLKSSIPSLKLFLEQSHFPPLQDLIIKTIASIDGPSEVKFISGFFKGQLPNGTIRLTMTQYYKNTSIALSIYGGETSIELLIKRAEYLLNIKDRLWHYQRNGKIDEQYGDQLETIHIFNFLKQYNTLAIQSFFKYIMATRKEILVPTELKWLDKY